MQSDTITGSKAGITIAAMAAASRPHKVTSWPARAAWMARAVPQAPAPRTLIFIVVMRWSVRQRH